MVKKKTQTNLLSWIGYFCFGGEDVTFGIIIAMGQIINPLSSGEPNFYNLGMYTVGYL